MIRSYEEKDIPKIELLGKQLHDNYKFNLNIYSFCYVIELENNIIGFIVYSIIYDRAEIIDIIVDEDYRNKHLGKLLLDKAIENINGCESISLEVNINNKNAIKFYQSNNFDIALIRKKYYKGEDAYLMIRKLEVK